MYAIGEFKDAFNAFETCTSNYRNCGYEAGQAYKQLTGFSIHNIMMSEEDLLTASPDNNVAGFIEGILDGMDCEHLNALKAELKTLLVDAEKVMEGDITLGWKVAEDWKVVKEMLSSLQLPNRSKADYIKIYMAHAKEINGYMSGLQTCTDGYDCGLDVGKVLRILLN